MRNDSKIIALRGKFGNQGYAVWCMMLEVLTASDNFEREIDELELELLAGDFRVSTTETQEILDFCCRIDLLQQKEGVYTCAKLVERLSPLVNKREYIRQKYTENGVSTTESGVSTEKMPQSKVKERKVNKYKYNFLEKNIKTLHDGTKAVWCNGAWRDPDNLDAVYDLNH